MGDDIAATSAPRGKILLSNLSGALVPQPHQITSVLTVAVANAGDLVESIEVSIDTAGESPEPPPQSVSLLPAEQATMTFAVLTPTRWLTAPPDISLVHTLFAAPVAFTVRAKSEITGTTAATTVPVLSAAIQAQWLALASVATEPARQRRRLSRWFGWLPAREDPPRQAGVDRQFHLLSDHPACGEEDLLGHDALARNLATILLDPALTTPFTLGIQGGWGSGKSTLMNLLQPHLMDEAGVQRKDVHVVWFNAWTAEGPGALTGLIRTVLQQLDRRFARRVVRRTTRTTWIKWPLVVLASWLGLRRLGDELWDRFSLDAAQRDQVRKEVHAAVADWADDTRRHPGGGRLMVVFVDDLDRCSPDVVIDILEAIRLYLDAPGLIFIVGYDSEVISQSLLRARDFGDISTARRYLEKILQVDMPVPRPTAEEVLTLIKRSAERAGAHTVLEDADYSLIADRSQRNPRRLKRFLNTFVLSRELDPGSTGLGADELIKLLLVRMYFPDFYEALLNDSGELLNQVVEVGLARKAARAGKLAAAELLELCDMFGAAAPASDEEPAAVLARLEETFPAAVRQVAQNDDLVALAWRMGSKEDRTSLMHRVRERLPLVPALEVERHYSGDRDGDLCTCGFPLLFLDPRPSSCPDCGRQLDPVRRTTPLETSATATVVCAMCGDVNHAARSWCSRCGSPLPRTRPPA